MLRRLLLTLLLLALSAPAMAMGGHCAQPGTDHAPALHHGDHGVQHKHPAPAQADRGDCIGCVLPGLGLAPALKAQAPAMVIGTAPERQTLALARQRPDTPPPRS